MWWTEKNNFAGRTGTCKGGIFIRRPLVWMLGALILIFLLYRAVYSERDDARYYIFQGIWQEKTSAVVIGEVERVTLGKNEEKGTNTSIFLKKCKIQIAGEEDVYRLRRLLVYCDGEQSLEPGYRLRITGSLVELPVATNPGQFDQRRYYKEKGIYYRFQAQDMKVTDTHRIWWRSLLYHFRDEMEEVYEICLPQKEAGVVAAMILGDKSLLDMDVKKLYQESGIGHLLAISGLHVTILGMAFYRLLRRMGVSVGFAVPSAIVVLLCYGCMTDFSISTSRAVVMMIFWMMAEWIGRTYDGKSALAFSGIFILLQKPFALFSCSFLLSFGAIAGIELLLPVFRFLVYGDGETVRRRKRRSERRNRELRANYRIGGFPVKMFSLGDRILSMFLASLSVQLMTLPVLLYFFYEIPVYGIIINLLVIPLASVVVLLSMLGGLSGCVFLPLGRLVLGSVFYLLRLYEWVCAFFGRLPGHMQILGCPAGWKIVVFYGLLFLMCGAVWCRKESIERGTPFLGQAVPGERGESVYHRGGKWWLLAVFCCSVLLFAPAADGHFRMTMLDVGQGDGIFLRTADGRGILVDGGSTSVSKVGEYRIIPYLKYSGVRQIDYMIMTHSDEDHMNGLLTVLEESGGSGPAVRYLVVPDVADKQAGGYGEIVSLARRKEIPVLYLSDGFVLRSGDLSITCLNPVKNFEGESANAGSITLSMRYRNFSCLLTGDLEGDGQEHVAEVLEHHREKYNLPDAYTLLKVAHHGSKNSTDEGFLELVSPEISLISCGKNNRYGHPHEELLGRLQSIRSQIYMTPQYGAVMLDLYGDTLRIKTYLHDG